MTVLDTAKSPEVVPVEGAQRVTLFLKDLPVRIALDRDAYNSRDVVQRRAVAVHHDETAVVCVDVPDGTTEADTAAALNEAESAQVCRPALRREKRGCRLDAASCEGVVGSAHEKSTQEKNFEGRQSGRSLLIHHHPCGAAQNCEACSRGPGE